MNPQSPHAWSCTCNNTATRSTHAHKLTAALPSLAQTVFKRLSTSPEGNLFNLAVHGITLKTWCALLALMGLQRNDGQNRGWVMSRKDARMIFMWSQMLVVEETSQVPSALTVIKHNVDINSIKETSPTPEHSPILIQTFTLSGAARSPESVEINRLHGGACGGGEWARKRRRMIVEFLSLTACLPTRSRTYSAFRPKKRSVAKPSTSFWSICRQGNLPEDLSKQAQMCACCSRANGLAEHETAIRVHRIPS